MLTKISSHSIKNEIKETFILSLPFTTSQLIYACSGFIGTALIAQLGQDALAASVLVSMIWWSLSVLFFGVLNSISVLVSHQHGAENHSTISEIMGQAYILGLFISVILFIVLFSMPFFLHWSKQPAAVLILARQYMFALLWTIPGLVVLVIHEQFLAGIGRTKLVLRISLMVVPIEIVLIYLLIFGKFGFPQFGVAGIGYGFAITYTLTAVWLTFYLLKAKYYKNYRIFANIKRINFHYLKELIRIGLPIGFMHAVEVIGFAVMTFWISQFGTTPLASHQIVMQYLGFAITLVFAMSQAVTVRVGHAVGRQDLVGVQYATYVGMLLNFLCVLIIALAFYLFPYFFLSLDLDLNNPDNKGMIQSASMLLSIAALLLIFDNFRIIGFGALRGLKDTRFPLYASLVGFWLVGLTCAYFFGFHLSYKANGVWWGMTIGIGCGMVLVFLRLHYLLNRLDLERLHKVGKIGS